MFLQGTVLHPRSGVTSPPGGGTLVPGKSQEWSCQGLNCPSSLYPPEFCSIICLCPEKEWEPISLKRIPLSQSSPLIAVLRSHSSTGPVRLPWYSGTLDCSCRALRRLDGVSQAQRPGGGTQSQLVLPRRVTSGGQRGKRRLPARVPNPSTLNTSLCGLAYQMVQSDS